MLRKNMGFPENTPLNEIEAKIAENNIQPDSSDSKGNFTWFFGYKNNYSYVQESPLFTPDTDKKAKKFQFIANMGLLDDNEILSNKLINIYGKRLFDMIHDKSRSLDAFESMSFRKKIGLASGVTSNQFSENKQIDMHLCWMMVQKIRAIQEIDTLLNTSTEDFQQNYDRVIKKITENIEALSTFIPRANDDTTGYIKAAYQAEHNEIQELTARLTQLTNEFGSPDSRLNDHQTNQRKANQNERNKIIQTWEKRAFRRFNYDFKRNQGKIGLYGLTLPLARENVSNSNAYQQAEYAIQEHVYAEGKPISKTHLWMVDNETCGDTLCSKKYASNSTQRKELLLGACIAEELKTDTLDKIDQINSNELEFARKQYQDRKTEMNKASLQAKAEKPYGLLNSFANFIAPQQTDPETGLQLTSREFSRYWRDIHLQFGGRKSLNRQMTKPFETLQNTVADELNAQFEQTNNDSEEKTPAANQNNTLPFQHAPVPDPISPLRGDDLVTATLDFAHSFMLFFDRDLMAQRPFAAMLFFSIPFMHMAAPVLASNVAFLGFLEKINSTTIAVEAALAKYTGLNALLQATLHTQITPDNIANIMTLIREKAAWFTVAEDPIEQAFVGMLIGKLLFNVGDAVTNGVFGDKDSMLLSQYFTTLFPDASGSLEGKTTAENLKNVAASCALVSLQLVAAAYGVGAIEHYLPFAKIPLSKFATVPWQQITAPALNINLLQTIGAAKAAGYVVLKAYGILNKVQSGQLIDIDGYKITKGSDGHKVLDLFYDLMQLSEEKRKEYNGPHRTYVYSRVREHFQELLAQNPALWEVYKGKNGDWQELKDLGVKKIVPKNRHKFTMAFVKTAPALLKMALGILPGLFITLPVLAASKWTGNTTQTLMPEGLKPIYRYGVESLNLTMKLPKIFWTVGKAVGHSFLAVALRTPEIIASVFFTALTVCTLFLLNSPIKKAHAVVAGGIREHFRYPVERAVGLVLRKCRNLFVRTLERELQILPSVEKYEGDLAPAVASKSTFDIQKAIKDRYPASERVAPPVQYVTPPVQLVAPPVQLVAPPLQLVDPPVQLVAPPVQLVAPPVQLVDPPLQLVDPPLQLVDPPVVRRLSFS